MGLPQQGETMAATARLQIVIDAVNDASDELQAIQKDLEGVGESSKKSGKQQESTLGSLKASYIDFRSFVGDVMGGVKELWDFGKEGAQAQQLQGAFDRLGFSMQDLNTLREASLGAINDQNLMLAANRAKMLGVAESSDQLAKLLQVASMRGQALGVDMTQAFSDIVTGIGRMSPLILDNLGIVTGGEKTFDDYAKSLGKTAAQLTDVEKKQALLNKVLGDLEGVGNIADTAATKFDRMQAKIDNATTSLKEFAAQGITAGIDLLESGGKLAEAFTASVAKMREEVMAGRMTVDEYNAALKGMADNMAGWVGPNVANLAFEQLALTETTGAAIQGAYGLSGALDESARASRRAAESAAAYKSAEEDKALAIQEGVDWILAEDAAMAAYNDRQAAATKAAQDAALAEQTRRGAIADSIVSIDNLAQSLGRATDAQAKQMLAQAALDTIKKAYEAGTISQAGFQRATDAILLRYDLATPKSLAMAKAQTQLNAAFLAGDVPLNDFLAAADKLPGIAEDAQVTTKELAELGIRPLKDDMAEAEDTARGLTERGLRPYGQEADSSRTKTDQLTDSINRIPKNIEIKFKITTVGSIPNVPSGGGGGHPGRQYGGPSGEGGLFMLHPNEWVLSEAQRYGRAPIPEEAFPSRGLVGNSKTVIYNNNFYDSLATKMFLEKERLEELAEVTAVM